MFLRSSMSAAAAVTLAAGLAFGLPAAASAAASSPAAVTGPQLDTANLYIFTRTHERGTGHKAACHAGAEYKSVNPVESVANNCEYRIFLYQHAGGKTGWNYCVNPHSKANVVPGKYHAPQTIKVGTKAIKC